MSNASLALKSCCVCLSQLMFMQLCMHCLFIHNGTDLQYNKIQYNGLSHLCLSCWIKGFLSFSCSLSCAYFLKTVYFTTLTVTQSCKL